MYPSTGELNLVFRKYDKNKDQMFSFEEFVDFICPRDENYRSMLIWRKAASDRVSYARARSFMPKT